MGEDSDALFGTMKASQTLPGSTTPTAKTALAICQMVKKTKHCARRVYQPNRELPVA
jgi:hypothetical protein